MKYEISEQLLQSILNYLSTKPFSEVNQLIRAIQSEASNQSKPENKKEKKKEK